MEESGFRSFGARLLRRRPVYLLLNYFTPYCSRRRARQTRGILAVLFGEIAGLREPGPCLDPDKENMHKTLDNILVYIDERQYYRW